MHTQNPLIPVKGIGEHGAWLLKTIFPAFSAKIKVFWPPKKTNYLGCVAQCQMIKWQSTDVPINLCRILLCT